MSIFLIIKTHAHLYPLARIPGAVLAGPRGSAPKRRQRNGSGFMALAQMESAMLELKARKLSGKNVLDTVKFSRW